MMMQSPFSPFVHRRPLAKKLQRRQSELPSDLIDWDAPEIPEVDKQRIIYEEYIKELNEDHVIEELINEEVYSIAHEAVLDSILKQYQTQNTSLLNQNNLLLNQHKILEDTVKDLDEQYKEMEFRNKELEAELSCQIEAFALKKSEALDFKRKWEAAENKLSFLKREKKIQKVN